MIPLFFSPPDCILLPFSVSLISCFLAFLALWPFRAQKVDYDGMLSLSLSASRIETSC